MNTHSLLYNRISKSVFLFLTLFSLVSCGGGGSSPESAVPATPTKDTSPEPFRFFDISNASLNTVIYSKFNELKGIDSTTLISITGGEYAINGVNNSAFTTQPGTIENGQVFQIRLTSASNVGEQTDAVLTIGDFSTTFSVTTTITGLAINLSPGVLALSENAGIGKFTIVLGAAPNESVIVTMTNPDPGEVLLDKTQVTFTTQNWQQPQAVIATAVNDRIIDLDQIVTITLAIDAASKDSSGYKNLVEKDLPTEIITIIDNGVAGLNIKANGPLDKVTGNTAISENAGVGTFDVKLTGRPSPSSVIDITIASNAPGAATLLKILPNTMSFTETNWNVAQTVTVVGLNDLIVNPDITLPISFSVSKSTNDNTGYASVVAKEFNVTVQNATVAAGVSVVPLNGVNLIETQGLTGANGKRSFTDIEVVLVTKPVTATGANASVSINVSSVTLSAAVVNKAQLNFNSSNWNIAQKIRVTSVNDDIVDGVQTSLIKMTIGTSTDPRYSALVSPGDVPDTTVNVADDDIIGVIVTPLTLGTMQEGTTKTFSVKLQSEPLSDVRFLVTATKGTTATTRATVNKSQLIFTRTTGTGTTELLSNWNTAQIVTVTAVSDKTALGDVPVNINLSISTTDTSGYNNPALNKKVSATIIDIDVPDQNGFLQFLNRSAPRNIENSTTGAAYYAAIDPSNKRVNLAAFKAFNNNLSDVVNAVYVNNADLGFGRRMYLTSSADGTVASCVENFAPAAGVNAPAQAKINLAKKGIHRFTAANGGLIATVCMEYSGTPGSGLTAGNLAGRKYVKFFSYGSNDNRIAQADLDGRGVKTQPGLCNICHGGQGHALVNGKYPYLGDTDAQFLPWDIDTFLYDADNTVPLNQQTLAKLRPIFKNFNKGVLATYPKPTTFSSTTPVNIPVNSSTGFSTITVPNSFDVPITSIAVSIDETPAGVAGLSLNNVAGTGVNIELISPAGKTYNFSVRPKVDTIVTEIRNLYMVDFGSDVKYDVNAGVGSGTVVIYDTDGFINNRGACTSATPVAQTTFELGCTSTKGAWQLLVSTNGCTASRAPQCLPRVDYSGTLAKWSIHFNGMPEQAYLPAPVELIRGWYAATPGDTRLLGTFNPAYVAKGWKKINNLNAAADTEVLYQKVIAPTCRACHIQRGSLFNQNIDFSSYSKFMIYKNSIKTLVYDSGLMPLAKRTYQDHFWKPAIAPAQRQADILAKHMPGYVANQTFVSPGRNRANAGLARSVSRGSMVLLSAEASLFPAKINNVASYKWIIKPPVAAQFNLTGKEVSFVATDLGNYRVTLDTSGGLTQFQNDALTKSTIAITSSSTIVPISFKTDIIAALSTTCDGYRCHGGNAYRLKRNQGRIKLVPNNVTPSLIDLKEIYLSIRERVNTFAPLQSVLIRKSNLELPHAGASEWSAYRLANFPSAKANYDIVVRWILEGAKNN